MQALALVGDRISGFGHWWLGELSACLPERLTSALRRGRQRLIVRMDAEEATFLFGRGQDLQELGSLFLDQGDAELEREQADALLAGQNLAAAEVVVRLARSNVLRRRAELPLAAGENLREVLGFEMDRHTPFRAEEVYFDFRVLDRDQANKRITVDLAIVTRAFADQALARLRNWGLAPQRLEVEKSLDDGEGDFDLLPKSARQTGVRGLRRVTLAGAAAAVLLLALALYLPIMQRERSLAMAEDRLTAVKADALRAEKLREEVEGLLKRGDYVVDQKRHRPAVAELLNEVTELLPDDTWVIQMNWSGNRLTLAGFSRQPTDLIARLEGSELLSGVRFNSPVLLDQRIGMERFNLSAQVERREEGS